MQPISESPAIISNYFKLFMNLPDTLMWFLENILENRSPTCNHCNSKMMLIKRYECPHEWRCKKCRHTISFFYKTSFMNIKTEFNKIMLIILLKWINTPQRQIIYITGLTKRTIRVWETIMRSICTVYLKEHPTILGGPGKTVQIDEAIIRKRKYNRGQRKEQIWVFGAVEDDKNDRNVFLSLVPDRRANTLIPLIVKHIRPGTSILSDEWGAYDALDYYADYDHKTVNHSLFFKDPITKVCTNRIEGVWSHLRRSFPKNGVRTKYLRDYISYFEVRTNLNWSFTDLLKNITSWQQNNNIDNDN